MTITMVAATVVAVVAMVAAITRGEDEGVIFKWR